MAPMLIVALPGRKCGVRIRPYGRCNLVPVRVVRVHYFLIVLFFFLFFFVHGLF
jgi:hypothetical protein